MKTPLLGPLAIDGFQFRGLKSYLFYGDKGNGKSMVAAYIADCLFAEYRKMRRKYPTLQKRVLYSSQKFGVHVEEKHLVSSDLENSADMVYWSSPRQLYDIRNADILWDEVGKDLPAGSWHDTPKQLKQVFSHLRKRGNRLFANTQIYNDIDISFRRQIDRTFKIRKFLGSPDISASLPPVKHPWGLIMAWEMDKNSIENVKNEEKQELTHKFAIPHFCLIEKELVNYYDTTMEIPPYRPTELEHIEYTCMHPGCDKIHVSHKKM